MNEQYADYFNDLEVMRRAAEAELLPDQNGALPPFFTTNRSYFMPLSDAVLAASDNVWV